MSSEGRYALRALVYLAQGEGRMTAGTISADARIPRRLLARTLAKLTQAGLLESSEGRNGGVELARSPEQITLREAVEAVEGPFEVTWCIMQQRACGEGVPCALHEAWIEAQESFLGYLQTQTLSEFISETVSQVQTADTPLSDDTTS